MPFCLQPFYLVQILPYQLLLLKKQASPSQEIAACVKNELKKAASGLEGVVEAVWSTETKKMVVKYNADKVSVSDIKKKIAAVGHDTDEFKASNDVYDKLPGCCLYDRMQ